MKEILKLKKISFLPIVGKLKVKNIQQLDYYCHSKNGYLYYVIIDFTILGTLVKSNEVIENA